MGFQQLAGLRVNIHDAFTAGVMDNDVAASGDVVADHRGQESSGAYGQECRERALGNDQTFFQLIFIEMTSSLFAAAGFPVVA